MILCDTGVLVCLVDLSQPNHRAYIQAVGQLDTPMLTTWACMTEAMYLSYRNGGYPVQRRLARLLLDGFLEMYAIQPEDYARIFDLIERYRDRPMDFADATLVLAAEETDNRG